MTSSLGADGYVLQQAWELPWLGMVVTHYEMFKNWPVTQSSQHVQFEEEGNMAASSNEQFYIKFTGFMQDISFKCNFCGFKRLE